MNKNYNYDSVYVSGYPSPLQFVNFSLNKISSTIFYQRDNLNVNITSYAAGKASGNFTISMTPVLSSLNYKNSGSVILEGTFQNIAVNYK